MQIEGGLTGIKADVTRINQLETFSQSIRPEWWSAVVDGRLFTLNSGAQILAGAAVFMYISNTGNADLVIASIDVHATAAGKFEVDEVTGTPVGGTAIVERPRKLGSPNELSGTFEAAISITGLTSAETHAMAFVDGTSSKKVEGVENAPIVIPTGQAIALDFDAAATVTAIVTLYQQLNRPVPLVTI